MTWNYDMSRAPKDRPILGLCLNQCSDDECPYSLLYNPQPRRTLCLYHAHVEGLSHVEDGPHVLVWGGGWADSWEDGGGSLPDWWFRSDSEFEVAANPIAFMEIPAC